jgi:hypothetical protein
VARGGCLFKIDGGLLGDVYNRFVFLFFHFAENLGPASDDSGRALGEDEDHVEIAEWEVWKA